MSTQYLVPCSCGRENTVSASQAGQRVACQCGVMLDVPPMRRLAHMARVEDPQFKASLPPIWSVSRGLLFLGLVIALPGFAMAGYLHFNRPQVDYEVLRQEIDDADVLTTWEIFRRYELFGLPKQDTIRTESLRKQGETVQSYINIGLGVGLLGLLVIGSSLLFRGPGSQ